MKDYQPGKGGMGSRETTTQTPRKGPGLPQGDHCEGAHGLTLGKRPWFPRNPTSAGDANRLSPRLPPSPAQPGFPPPQLKPLSCAVIMRPFSLNQGSPKGFLCLQKAWGGF